MARNSQYMQLSAMAEVYQTMSSLYMLEAMSLYLEDKQERHVAG
jgi:hypothetical protein